LSGHRVVLEPVVLVKIDRVLLGFLDVDVGLRLTGQLVLSELAVCIDHSQYKKTAIYRFITPCKWVYPTSFLPVSGKIVACNDTLQSHTIGPNTVSG
jgi:hypothetical protein